MKRARLRRRERPVTCFVAVKRRRWRPDRWFVVVVVVVVVGPPALTRVNGEGLRAAEAQQGRRVEDVSPIC